MLPRGLRGPMPPVFDPPWLRFSVGNRPFLSGAAMFHVTNGRRASSGRRFVGVYEGRRCIFPGKP